MKHKVNDVVTVASTANPMKYRRTPLGWCRGMTDIMESGKKLRIRRLIDDVDGEQAICVDSTTGMGSFTSATVWFLDDLVPAAKNHAVPGIYCVTDERTSPILTAAVKSTGFGDYAATMTMPICVFDGENVDRLTARDPVKWIKDRGWEPVQVSVLEFIERMMNGYETAPPLMYKDWVVKITPTEVEIGCTSVDRSFVTRVAERIGEEFSTDQGVCRFDDRERVMSTGKFEVPYDLILEIAKRIAPNQKTQTQKP